MPYANYETVMHVIANQAQLDWMLVRWAPHPGDYYRTIWRIGYTQALDGSHLNDMLRALGGRFGERPALQRWWEPEIANLPLDIASGL